MMKRHTLFFLVAFAFISLRAQNWRPISFGETHHFRSDTAGSFPDRSIRVDSTLDNPGDTTWHLTRYLEEVSEFVALKNSPGFLQRDMRLLPGGWYQFKDPGNIAIHATAAQGESWVLDSMQSIVATVERVWAGTVLGQADSLKLLRLTGGDSLILSRDHGLVEWPPALGSGHFVLAGLQQQAVGDRYPTFDEWFPYQVGQQFFWGSSHSVNGGPGSWSYFARFKVVVDSVFRNAAGIRVKFSGLLQRGDAYWPNGLNWGPVTSYSNWEFSIFDNDSSAFSRLHTEPWLCYGADRVFAHRNLMEFLFADNAPMHMGEQAALPAENIALLPILSHDGSAQVLSLGNWVSTWEMDTISPATQDTLRHLVFGNCQYRIRSGVGIEYVQWDAIEMGGVAELAGYVTLNGDTIGTTWQSWFLNGVEDAEKLMVQVFPNPASSSVQLNWPAARPWRIELVDGGGQVIHEESGVAASHTLDFHRLPAGIYSLRMSQSGRTTTQRLALVR